MSKAIDEAVSALRARDASDYRKARAAYHAAGAEYDAQARMIGALGKREYQRLEGYLKRALAPHRIEWRTHGRDTGHDVNGDDWTTSAHIYGEVWPEPQGGRYNMQMRAHIPFSLTPRDGAEFRQMVKVLKAAADAMAEAGL